MSVRYLRENSFSGRWMPPPPLLPADLAWSDVLDEHSGTAESEEQAVTGDGRAIA